MNNKVTIIIQLGGKPKGDKTTKIRCPACSARLLDTPENVIMEVVSSSASDDTPAEYYMKCWKCGSSIGIQKVNR